MPDQHPHPSPPGPPRPRPPGGAPPGPGAGPAPPAPMTAGAKLALVVGAVAAAFIALATVGVLALGLAVLARQDAPFDSRFADARPGLQGQDRPGPGPRGDRDGDQRRGDGGNRRGSADGSRPGGGLAGLGGLHGEYVVTVDGTSTTMLFQTGEVTRVEDTSSLTVKSADGFTATYQRGTDTVVRARREPLQVGARVVVTARKDGSVATRVVVLPSPRPTAP